MGLKFTHEEVWYGGCSFLLMLLLGIVAGVTGTDRLTAVYAMSPAAGWAAVVVASPLTPLPWLTSRLRWWMGASAGLLLCIAFLTLINSHVAYWAASAILVVLLISILITANRR